MRVAFGLVALLCSFAASGATETADPVFRKPFTLTLRVDKERYYEEEFKAIPYTFERDIYLFKGDKFGVRLSPEGVPVYEPDPKKADLELAFSQNVNSDGAAMMLLVLANHTTKTMEFEGLMTVPGRKDIQKTSLLPLGPGITNYESWPHPIVQLVLRNPRLK
jgi:hypothetical protein